MNIQGFKRLMIYEIFEVLMVMTMKITVHTEKSNKMQHCIKIYYSIFIRNSTCFGRHTAHHQEPKTALAASGLHTWKVVGHVQQLYSIFIRNSTCFGRHTAHHQEPIIALAASGLHTWKVVGHVQQLYSIFIINSTCFGQHTAHHQKPKTALAASGLHMWKVVGHVQQLSTNANQRLLVQF